MKDSDSVFQKCCKGITPFCLELNGELEGKDPKNPYVIEDK